MYLQERKRNSTTYKQAMISGIYYEMGRQGRKIYILCYTLSVRGEGIQRCMLSILSILKMERYIDIISRKVCLYGREQTSSRERNRSWIFLHVPYFIDLLQKAATILHYYKTKRNFKKQSLKIEIKEIELFIELTKLHQEK